MAGSPRRDIIRDGEIATYHVWSQTAQQRFLLGRDRGPDGTLEDFGYRREWCESLLEHQARVFAVDISTHQFLSNHFHIVLRTRPDLVAQLSDEEIAYRWLLAWADFDRKRNRWSRVPTDAEVKALLTNQEKLETARHGLASLSWFIGRLKESVSREANAEVGTKGHFWAGRFGSRELVDDAAILTCSVYVDLNQLRAGMAPSLLESQYTAIQSRILQGRLEEAEAAHAMFQKLKESGVDLTLEQLRDMYFKCRWLAPVTPQGDLKMMNDAWCAQGTRKVPTSILPKANQPDLTPSLAGLYREFGLDVDTETLVRDLEAEWQSRRLSPVRKSELELPDSSMQDSSNSEVQDAAGSEQGNSDPSCREEAEETGSEDMEGSQSKEPVPPEKKNTPGKKKRKDSPKKKAEPTYEIHNRLCQQLPDRASNSPVLAIPPEQYLSLVLAAAKRFLDIPQLKENMPIPTDLADHHAAILNKQGINPDAWYAALDGFDEFFGYVLGSPDRVKAFASRAGRRCVHGITACRELFLTTVQATGVNSAPSPPEEATTGPPSERGSPE
jgi:hypothetical protein